MKTKYIVTFKGRLKNSIGEFGHHQAEIQLDGLGHTDEEIKLELYENFEHISSFLIKTSKQIKEPYFV
jgi:hypothetical protein